VQPFLGLGGQVALWVFSRNGFVQVVTLPPVQPVIGLQETNEEGFERDNPLKIADNPLKTRLLSKPRTF
jgi:hypothetical protein